MGVEGVFLRCCISAPRADTNASLLLLVGGFRSHNGSFLIRVAACCGVRSDCFSVLAEDDAGESYPPAVFGAALGGGCGVDAAVGECGVARCGDEGREGEGDDEQRDYHPPEC